MFSELGIELICANSPQAKGHVERANQTLKDRLIKEMRLEGISCIEAANAWLDTFIADFNRRFARPAKYPIDLGERNGTQADDRGWFMEPPQVTATACVSAMPAACLYRRVNPIRRCAVKSYCTADPASDEPQVWRDSPAIVVDSPESTSCRNNLS